LLTEISSKINYRKPWWINKLKPEQTMYAAYDVAFIFDLLVNMTNIIRPVKDTNNPISVDVLSIINRVYRFYMTGRLKIDDTVQKCINIVDSYKMKKDDLLAVD